MQCYNGRGQPGSPLLLYNYLRTNTLHCNCFCDFFFLSCFLNVWIYKLLTVLRNKEEVEGGKEKDSGVRINSTTQRTPARPSWSWCWGQISENPVYCPCSCSRLKLYKVKNLFAWEAVSFLHIWFMVRAPRSQWGLTWDEPSSPKHSFEGLLSVQTALCILG